MTSFGQKVENIFETTIADVESWAVKIKTGAEVAAEDLEKGLNALAAQAPAIATGVQEVETMVEQVLAATPGAAQNATVTAAIAQANAAVAGLNAFATAADTGTSQPQALVAGYVAYQQANAAISSAKAAVISTPTAAATTAAPAA